MRSASDVHPSVSRAESVRLSRAAIEGLADEIPADEQAVGGLLQQCIDGYFARAFTSLALAALHRGVPVDARHLVMGARLLPDPILLGRVASHMNGDVIGSLLGAVVDGRQSIQRDAAALFLAAHWSRERGVETHREQMVRRTRLCARFALGEEVEAFVAATAEILADEELSRLIGHLPVRELLPVAREWTEPFLESVLAPLLEGLDDEDEIVPPSAMRRRAVARVGRNEPCPCGSGRKYKRCCMAKDEERLRDSSDVAGVTRAEIRLHLEDHLTFERVISLRPHELARLDPRRVDPALYGTILNRLIPFEELDAARDFLEAVGTDCSPGHFWDAIDMALRTGSKDTARALLKMAPPAEEGWSGFSQRLLAEGIESSPALDLLEAEARRNIDGGAVDVAFDLLRSSWPCVGILIARGAAPLANPFDRDTLVREVGRTRDLLDLPALEPTGGLDDAWDWDEEPELWDEPAATPGAAQAETSPDDGAQRRLGEKEAEVTRLRGELAELHRRLDEQEKLAAEAKADAPPASGPPPTDPRVDSLRERVSRLRTELSQRHTERNQLRRQLERTLTRVDTLEAERKKVDETPDVETDDDPEAEPTDAPVALSFRVPVFSRRFRDSAEAAPDAVRRRAVVVASRIAAGDENAFRGTRRLRADRDLYRQRVGREHRLIFRMGPEELEAVDLVARKDLERTIREITRR